MGFIRSHMCFNKKIIFLILVLLLKAGNEHNGDGQREEGKWNYRDFVSLCASSAPDCRSSPGPILTARNGYTRNMSPRSLYGMSSRPDNRQEITRNFIAHGTPFRFFGHNFAYRFAIIGDF